MKSPAPFFNYKTASRLVIIELFLTYSYYLYSWVESLTLHPQTVFNSLYVIQSLFMLYIWWTFRKALKERFSVVNMDGFFYLLIAVIAWGQISYLFGFSGWLPSSMGKYLSLGYSAAFIAFAIKLLSLPQDLYGLKKKLVYSMIAIYVIGIGISMYSRIYEMDLLFQTVQFGAFIASLLNTIYMFRFFKNADRDPGKEAINPLNGMIDEIGH